jgi:hypothetical protein
MTDSRVPHTRSYDDAPTFAQTSAATVAARRTTALPVSVRRNCRSGVCRLRAHAVRPANSTGPDWDSVTPGFSPVRPGPSTRVAVGSAKSMLGLKRNSASRGALSLNPAAAFFIEALLRRDGIPARWIQRSIAIANDPLRGRAMRL